ncbi:MAG: HAD family hydrolase [Caldisericia bacterium]|nr:HAD family hydrolase [Caldisericia bacterium]
MSIKALLFDLDDTLYDEKQFVESGFIKVAEFIENKFKFNKKDFYKILIDIFNRGSRGNIFNLALEKVNIIFDENIIYSMVKIYREHNPAIKLEKDIGALLIKLKSTHSLGIITDGYLEVQKRKVQALKLGEIFDTIIYTDEYGKEYWKPNVFGYKLALKELGYVLPEETIYIGDNPYKDFIGAKKVGITTVRIINQNREYSNVKLNKEYEADYEIRKLNDIINLLKKF